MFFCPETIENPLPFPKDGKEYGQEIGKVTNTPIGEMKVI